MSPLLAERSPAVADGAIPGLARALDPPVIERLLQRCAASLGASRLTLERIQVLRHKPGRRCLLEYRVRLDDERIVALLAKVRARGADTRTFMLHRRLAQAGFREEARVFVPAAIGLVPEAGLWLQRRVDGAPVTAMLGTPGGSAAATQVAEALAALQQSNVRPHREHGAAEELGALERQLAPVASDEPALGGRLDRVLAGAGRLASCLDSLRVPIHRDFYQDQLILRGPSTCLLDLDLFSLGHPAVDAGNFAAHLIELGLRQQADPRAFQREREAFEVTWLDAQGRHLRQALTDCTTLTLARHIGLSWRLPGRRHLTAGLLLLTEARLTGRPACDPCW